MNNFDWHLVINCAMGVCFYFTSIKVGELLAMLIRWAGIALHTQYLRARALRRP